MVACDLLNNASERSLSVSVYNTGSSDAALAIDDGLPPFDHVVDAEDMVDFPTFDYAVDAEDMDSTPPPYVPSDDDDIRPVIYEDEEDIFSIPSVISYTVYFNANGGTVSKSSMVVYGNSTYGTLPVPVRSGYLFTGWYTSGGLLITASSTVNLTKDETLYAHWEKDSVQPVPTIDVEVSTECVFCDVPQNSPYYSAVSRLCSVGIMNGVSDTIFAPNKELTRAEAAMLVCRIYNYLHGMNVTISQVSVDCGFSDVGNSYSWASQAILQAKKLGIINGIGNNKFAPEKSVTAQEYMKMLICLLFMENSSFPDNYFPNGYIYISQWLGLLESSELQNIAYENPVSRGNVALMSAKVLDISERTEDISNLSVYSSTDENRCSGTHDQDGLSCVLYAPLASANGISVHVNLKEIETNLCNNAPDQDNAYIYLCFNQNGGNGGVDYGIIKSGNGGWKFTENGTDYFGNVSGSLDNLELGLYYEGNGVFSFQYAIWEGENCIEKGELDKYTCLGLKEAQILLGCATSMTNSLVNGKSEAEKHGAYIKYMSNSDNKEEKSSAYFTGIDLFEICYYSKDGNGLDTPNILTTENGKLWIYPNKNINYGENYLLRKGTYIPIVRCIQYSDSNGVVHERIDFENY